MKLYKIPVFMLLCTVAGFMSCDGMNDLHLKYLETGEKIYAAKVDSVSPGPGKERIEMEVFIYAQRIDHLRFYWNAGGDSLDFNIGNQIGVFRCMIENLPEREYLFEIVSFDKFGNRSLPFEVSSLSYGESYQNYLVNRRTSTISIQNGAVVIEWLGLTEDAVFTTLYYKDSQDQDKEIVILPTESTTTIDDYKPGSEYRYVTSYRPVANSPDLFETEETTGLFPELSLQKQLEASGVKGVWHFEDASNLEKATTGKNLVAYKMDGNGTVGSPSLTGFSQVSGPTGDNFAVRVPLQSYFRCDHGFAAGSNGKVTSYTLLIDVKVPVLGRYYTIFETDNLEMTSDGDGFIRPGADWGIRGNYTENVRFEAEKWYRMVITVASGIASYYLNGVLVDTKYPSVDGHASWLPEAVFLFADNDGEDNEFDIATVAIWDKALNDGEVKLLGKL
jgi:hypothetical protein